MHSVQGGGKLVSSRAESRTRGSWFNSPLCIYFSEALIVADVLGKVEQSLPERESLPTYSAGRDRARKQSQACCNGGSSTDSSVLSRDLCGVLSLRNLPLWILQKRVCGFGVYTLQLIMQMCGQCSLLFPGAVLKLFKAMGIDLYLETFRGIIPRALPLAYDLCF